jgi:tRNA pseudouridine38-40 synthase
MARYKLLLEYDGTGFRGWQVQKNARSVQGELLRAARELCGGEVDVQGAGRTDAGVHALGQVAHVETATAMEPFRLVFGLNDLLPADVNILHAERTHPRFHARHHAEGRSYLYLITTRRSAFAQGHSWWLRDRLDLRRMQAAAACFQGFHDFGSFADRDLEPGASTTVDIDEVQIEAEQDLILFRIAGSHFLWKMVRRIVGTLVEVGRGRLDQAQVKALLASRSTQPAQWTAPPCGLYLQQVRYKDEPWQPLCLLAFPLAH